MVRMTGLEPARLGHQILSLARLPVPPHPHFWRKYEYICVSRKLAYTVNDIIRLFRYVIVIFLTIYVFDADITPVAQPANP
jgi:hypothetical protein